MAEEIRYIFFLDGEDNLILIEDECAELKPILKEFVEYYAANKDKPVEEWLRLKLQEQLPDREPEEITQFTNEIIATLKIDKENQESLSKAVSNGRSKESWFSSAVRNVTSAMSRKELIEYLDNLDKAIKEANTSFYNALKTQADVISKNPNLDGFIAEHYHEMTFNLNAEAAGSQYHAKVLEPKGKRYPKNSVDLVIVDGSDKIAKRYQSKYGKDAKATERLFEHGNYRGQQKLVPKGQETEIQKKVTTVLEAPDGTTSNPLTKAKAEQIRDEVQSGKWNESTWNEYNTKILTNKIGKQAANAAVQGAVIGAGFDVAQKLWSGEKIEGEEVIETALASGADFGVKAAAAGALKVGVEKEIITVLPKGIGAGSIANIAHIAVEDAKIMGKMASGELSLKEGVEKVEQTTVATFAGLKTTVGGAELGTKVGVIFGPVGSVLGGFVGGTVGYMAGSTVGETIVKGAQKMRSGIIKAAKKVASGVKDVASTVTAGVGRLFSGVANFFGF